ncbi:MAG TPA: PadR family transcriptional regulator [Anaerolineae bacterium]|nr:PadR family transcriptional regulator [Anaerolineae bacterium]HQI87303.1 PadR family transcriptional regulator [Anaerolineae bacterium]
MSLEYAILGFLNYKPLSGYDLKKIFDTSVQHFWPADQSQIYRTLTHLAEQGWAEMEIVEQSERPDRKVYHITAAGREALRQWLLTPLRPHIPRNADLIQVFFAGQLSNEEILAMFERAAARLRVVLKVYEQIPQQVEEYHDYMDSPREFFCWMLTLEAGFKSAQANLAWLEDVIRRIKNGEMPER